MSDLLQGRSAQLDRVLSDLLRQAPEVEAASVVSFDGLPMASALPATMDENRVAAMSAALLSLGERAAEGLGRGELSQVYVEGESGTVFLISAEDEAVLVAVGARGAKVGLLLYEIRRAAHAVGVALRQDEPEAATPEPWSSEPVDEVIARAEEAVYEAQVLDELTADEPVVDDSDPLGLDDRREDTADDDAHDDAHEDSESTSDEPAYAGTAPQPTPDLGAWATFSPGSTATASGSSSSNDSSSWS
jgi:predicted regulator of Ras-like GTPase activity (Roadblock/LC7/MglB family)